MRPMTMIQTGGDVLDMLRRRAGQTIFVMALGFLASMVVGLAQQPAFRATALLQVAGPRVTTELADSAAAPSLAASLPQLRERILSRDTLEDVARDDGSRPDPAGETGAERLGRAVRIVLHADARPATVEVSAVLPDPAEARRIAGALARRMIRLSEETRLSEARATRDFLQLSESEVSARLDDIDRRIAAPGDLVAPEDLGGLRRERVMAQADLLRVSQARRRAQTALELEERGQSEHLDVVDAAEAPRAPVADRQLPLVALGGALSAVVALAAALLAEARAPVIRTAAQMRRVTALGPVLTVPTVELVPDLRPWHRRLLDRPGARDDRPRI